MAVKIDIPGIGIVTAENAASEETLRSILAAMQKLGSSRPGADPQSKANQDAAKSAKGLADSAKNATSELTKISVGVNAAADGLMKSLKNLGLTATAVAVKFMTNYADIADNPIKAGRELINTGIDIVGDFASGLAKAIPFIGEAASASAQLAAELAKAANNIFADQLQKNVDALQTYNKVGVSFFGGMQEMSLVATAAGLGIKDFSTIVTKAKNDINLFGMAGGEGAQKLSSGLGAAASMIGKSGQNLRTEMFKMGYTYEEQGVIMSSFMANMAASGRLRGMSDREIADGTRKYATDLKVLADITGQDAKKLMERARAETMRGSLMNRLTNDQKTAFQGASATLSKVGPEVQHALTQMVAGETVTDARIANNTVIMDMLNKVAGDIRSGNKDIIETTDAEARKTAKTMSKGMDGYMQAVDDALIFNVQGLASDIARVNNQFVAAYGPDADPLGAKKSRDANESQAVSQEQLMTQTAELYDATKKFQILMESEVNKELGKYAGLLEKVNAQTLELLRKGINAISGQSSEDDIKEKYGKQDPINAAQRMATDKATYEFKQKREEAISKMNAADAAEARKELERKTKPFMGPARKNLYEEHMKTIDVPKKEMAIGGIVSGSNSGYNARLHGTEAVVPLPDNRSIPVSLDSSSITAAVHQQSGILAEILRAMQNNNSLTSQIVQNSY